VGLGDVRVSEVITEADGRLVWWFEDGRTIISDTHGYTETHTIQVKAYDAAGNVSETEEILIFLMHEQEEEEEAETVALLPEPALLPANGRDERRGSRGTVT
jgi:hypothetical protein